jgi:hypothetical protein
MEAACSSRCARLPAGAYLGAQPCGGRDCFVAAHAEAQTQTRSLDELSERGGVAQSRTLLKLLIRVGRHDALLIRTVAPLARCKGRVFAVVFIHAIRIVGEIFAHAIRIAGAIALRTLCILR